MRVPRIIRNLLLTLAAVLIVAGVMIASTWLYLHPNVERVNGVVYGQRQGQNLALDVLRPANTNTIGVVVMVSGGWKSSTPGSFQPWMAAPLLRRGYTVFAVYHISQPKATVMEIVEDVNRAIRFIRHNAREYGVDPQRLGVTGGSAGGHLSLMLATRGAPGAMADGDPIDRESSAVQAVAIFFPVTDLLNLGSSTENPGNGGPPKSFVKAFGPQSQDLAVWKVIGREMSPIYYVHSNQPPTLIFHGDADTLVPLDQSERFLEQSRKLGCTVELIIHHGGGHGWWTMIWDIRQFAKWFDRYLAGQQTQRGRTAATGSISAESADDTDLPSIPRNLPTLRTTSAAELSPRAVTI
jgi:acetyl esterase/lipase